MNRDLGQPIAYGRTAEIYAWEKDGVLKLFYDWVGLDGIEYEAKIARAVHASGLPVPAVGEIVQVNRRNGLVFQRVYGTPMAKIFARRPWRIFQFARQMAQLHAEMHSIAIHADIPQQRSKLMRNISSAMALPDPIRSKALEVLQTLPEGNQLCHGDFHPENILLTAQGEVIIDWIDASRGNPLADLARTTIILLGSAENNPTHHPLEKGFIRLFIAEYIRHYFRLRPGDKDEYQRWLGVVAAGRLNENIPELEKWLIAQAETLISG